MADAQTPQESTRPLALITGGSRGIGRAICEQLACDGYDIALIYAGNEQSAAQTVESLEELGIRARAWCCDVSDLDAATKVCAEIIENMGPVHVLVNNAGITRDTLVARMSEDDFDRVIDINLKGAFNMVKALYRNFLRTRGARIINISSVVGLMGNAGQANYAASKAGLIGLTKSLARELSSREVTVNAVAPGFISTEMTDAMPQAAREDIESRIPLTRLGTPHDVAGVVSFLASPSAAYITGEVIRVDGGLAM